MFNKSIRVAAQQSRLSVAHVRSISSTPRYLAKDPNRTNSERHATHKARDPIEGGLDVQNAAVRSASDRAEHGRSDKGEAHDVASEEKGGKPGDYKEKEMAQGRAANANEAAQAGSFTDHRGGTPGEGVSAGEVGGKEEAAAPSVLATVKSSLGFSTSKKDHQESKTGPTTNRGFHTSARVRADEKDGKKDDGKGNLTPVDQGIATDQNPHLKHKEAGEPDSGKGNAASTPHLPSAARAANDERTDKESQQKARYHTSARRLSEPKGGYAAATIPEPANSGYDVPAQAFPNAEPHHSTPPPASPDLIGLSNLQYSSTAAAPAHPETRKRALNDTLGERNPPPSAEVGEIGLDEAWKSRKA